jgi:hypothetical protein
MEKEEEDEQLLKEREAGRAYHERKSIGNR